MSDIFLQIRPRKDLESPYPGDEQVPKVIEKRVRELWARKLQAQ